MAGRTVDDLVAELGRVLREIVVEVVNEVISDRLPPGDTPAQDTPDQPPPPVEGKDPVDDQPTTTDGIQVEWIGSVSGWTGEGRTAEVGSVEAESGDVMVVLCAFHDGGSDRSSDDRTKPTEFVPRFPVPAEHVVDVEAPDGRKEAGGKVEIIRTVARVFRVLDSGKGPVAVTLPAGGRVWGHAVGVWKVRGGRVERIAAFGDTSETDAISVGDGAPPEPFLWAVVSRDSRSRWRPVDASVRHDGTTGSMIRHALGDGVHDGSDAVSMAEPAASPASAIIVLLAPGDGDDVKVIGVDGPTKSDSPPPAGSVAVAEPAGTPKPASKPASKPAGSGSDDEIVALWKSKKKNRHLPYLFGFSTVPTRPDQRDEFVRRHRDIMGFEPELVGGYGYEHAKTWDDLAGGGRPDDLRWWKSKHLSRGATTAGAVATASTLSDIPAVWISSVSLPHEHAIQARSRDRNNLHYLNPYRNIIYKTHAEAARVWQRVASGEFDEYYRRYYARWATLLAESGRDTRLIAIDLDPENTGSWKHCNPGPDLQAYRDAWKRRVDILRDAFERYGTGRPLVVWRGTRWAAFGPEFRGRWDEFLKRRRYAWEAFPGEDAVDVVGIPDMHNPSPWRTREEWLRFVAASKDKGDWAEGTMTIMDWYAANTKRVVFGITEWQYFDREDRMWKPLADPDGAFAWTKEMLDRYSDRILFAMYTSWGQILRAPAFRRAIAANWGSPS